MGTVLRIEHDEPDEKDITITGDGGDTVEKLTLQETPREIGPPEYSLWERLNPFVNCVRHTFTVPLETVAQFGTIDDVTVHGEQQNTIRLVRRGGDVVQTIEPDT